MSADAPNPLEGLTRVLLGQRHEVYCNGKKRIWVSRPEIDRNQPILLWSCPDCVCSAFAEGSR